MRANRISVMQGIETLRCIHMLKLFVEVLTEQVQETLILSFDSLKYRTIVCQQSCVLLIIHLSATSY